MNDITHTLGLLRSEVRDARALMSNLDIQVRRLFEPRRRDAATRWPGRQARRVPIDRAQGKTPACRRGETAFRPATPTWRT
jgi:hypothetical protein